MQDPLLKSLSELSGAFRARLTAHIEKNMPELTQFQVHLLTMIGRNSGASQQDLATMMSRDKAQIARAIKGLEARGLIRREACVEDARSQHVRLSDQGAKICHAADAYREDLAAYMFRDLTKKDRAIMESALQTMIKRIGNT